MTSPPENLHTPVAPSTPSLHIDIPGWAWEPAGSVFASLDDRMALVIDLARRNIQEGGGPFGAGIFAADGTFVAPGINRVVLSSVPIAHAEIVAIGLAAQRLGTWDVAAAGSFQLVSTTEPCAMCLGAVPWAGVDHLVCGARDADARAVGFDEGAKPDDWVGVLKGSGLTVSQDVLRDEAVALLRDYASAGGAIYNGRS